MKVERFTAAILGLGRIGLGYDLPSGSDQILTHAKAYREHPGFHLVGGVDPDLDKKKAFETFSQSAYYESAHDLFEDHRREIDCISVCTPTPSHLSNILELASYSIKLVLLEKPLAFSLEEAEKIVASINPPTRLAVNYIRRWDPAFIEIKDIIQTKKLGEPSSLTCLYSQGLFNYASHAVDLLHYWFGPEQDRMFLRSKTIGAMDPNVEFVLRYGRFDANFHCLEDSQPSILEMDIIFENGKIKILNNGWEVQYHEFEADKGGRENRNSQSKPKSLDQDLDRYQYNVIDGMFRYLSDGEPLASDGTSALSVLKTCTAIHEESLA